MRLNKLILCLAAGLAATPALSQSSAILTPAPPAREDTVGPEQLRDFSLGTGQSKPASDGATSTAPAPRSPAAATTSTAPATAASDRQASTGATRSRTGSAEPAPATQPEPARTASVDSSGRAQPAVSPARSVTVPLSPPTPSGIALDSAPTPPVAIASPQPVPASDLADGSGSGSSMLIWVLLLIAAAGAAGAYWLLRQRGSFGRPAFAGHGFDLTPTPEPGPRPAAQPLQRAPVSPPAPAPRAPVPAPAPAPIGTGGIVSSRLRPWVDLDLRCDRAVVDDDGVTIFFEVSAINSGGAPARDIKVEAVLLNAGQQQDQDLRLFFERPSPSGPAIEVLPPLARVDMPSQVRLQREAIREFEVGGRKLFVPIVAFNASYRLGTGEARTSVSFLVGRTASDKTGKMGPIRMDLGARIFRGLDQRRNEGGIRR